ncbi:hypothetical protein EDF60_2281 [Leucobacter luti]|uniref:hypothetical protein n=1 Tax=Leucobacter luti TaxID=340320 RepID=UPI00104B0650|nr:hypothetical protein [Leucobacter luti]MCW2289262.1 hypothetical protein [Leucobacter luti]TCK39825.1 hypothetical protein EDF60_2281 [Leucobacter luti]
MNGTRRRIAPALAMAVGIIGALALLALFPAYALGDWNRPVDPWETARVQLLEINDSNASSALGAPIDPDTFTLLEDTGDGGMLFAALTTEGAVVAGVADTTGQWQSLCSSADTGPSAQVTCETWASDGERAYGFWVQRSDSAPHGFRYDITYGPRGS